VRRKGEKVSGRFFAEILPRASPLPLSERGLYLYSRPIEQSRYLVKR